MINESGFEAMMLEISNLRIYFSNIYNYDEVSYITHPKLFVEQSNRNLAKNIK